MRKSLLYFGLSIFIFTGCHTAKTTKPSDADPDHGATLGNYKDWLPPDFDPKNTTLMIEMPMSTSQEQKMVDYLKEKYPWRCTFVYTSDVYKKTGTFGDINKYRFALMNTSYLMERFDPTKGSASVEDFYFYDRLNDKAYPNTKKGSYTKLLTFKPLINTIVQVHSSK